MLEGSPILSGFFSFSSDIEARFERYVIYNLLPDKERAPAFAKFITVIHVSIAMMCGIK